MANNQITVEEWMKKLAERAKESPAMRNYLRHHHFTGVSNGVANWIRLPSYWSRSKYTPGANVPGSVRRRLAREAA